MARKEAQERVVRSMVDRCLKWQRSWAGWMQDITERLSRKGKLIAMSIFCLLFGGYSFYQITHAIAGKQGYSISITSVKKPEHLQKSAKDLTKMASVITKEEYLRLQHFTAYMDNLALSPKGKIVYDSILASRPGLMDSIQFIIKNYQSPTKK